MNEVGVKCCLKAFFMIDKQRAIELMQKYLAHVESGVGEKLVIVAEATREKDFGWVFFYQSEAYLKSGEMSHMLLGNAPVIVDKNSGELIETGTAYPTEQYIENYEKYGDPHAFENFEDEE